ncbi:MAG TPA: ABC transporter permease [Longimicrobiaceae bacterium]
MRRILALIRIHWLTFTSYRLNVVFSIVGTLTTLVPVFLIGRALQPVVADSIANEGGVYFGFLVTGLAAMQLVGVSIRSIPASISGGISSGTLEALLATPASMPQLLAGMTGYGMLWATAKAATLILGIVIFGGAIALKGLPLAILILVLLVLAHLPLGLLLASGVLVFRTTGPIGPTVMGAFGLLGGVYYSTSVIPEVVRPLASLVPLTYGLRAFRRALLSGDSFSAVAVDLGVLALLAAVLMVVGLAAFRWSLRYARRTGTLSQY